MSFCETYVFGSCGCAAVSRTDGWYSSSVLSVLKKCQSVFQSDCIVLHFHQQSMRVPVSLHPHQHCHLAQSHPIRNEVVLCCGLDLRVLLMASNAGHLFMSFASHLQIFLGEASFANVQANHFFIGLCIFLWLSFNTFYVSYVLA